MVSFKQLAEAVGAARPTQDEMRKEVERLRIEVGLATMHINHVIIEEADVDVEALMPPEAAIRGFNSPDDFVVKQGSLNYSDGASYKGELLGNLRHGEGSFLQANGTRYTGQWQYDLLEGRGRAVTASGQVFEGEFRNGRAHGQGTAVYEDGGRYEGDWEADGRHGWGRHAYPSGDVYEGEWANDAIHGQGRLTKTDGSFYEGAWEAGALVRGRWTSGDGGEVYDGEWRGWERHGRGVLFINRVFKYEGNFEGGERHGQGRCEWAGGGVYEGAWRAGQRHGQGSFSERDLRYEGQWDEDVFHGEGLLAMASGERYLGGFQRGRRHGFGRWISADGEKYQGQWSKGERHGQGTCVYANGDVYTGEWAGGVRCGVGRCVFADGSAFSGRWEDDGWVQSAADPARCEIDGSGVTRAVAGEAAGLVIRAADEERQPRLCGGDEFQVRLVLAQDEDGSSLSVDMCENGVENSAGAELMKAVEAQPCPPPLTVTAEVTDRDDGTYEVSYTADVAGVYELHVTTGAGGAEHVAASPYPLRVLPAAPAAKKTIIAGQGRSVAASCANASFSIELRDEFGNLCAAGAAAPVAARLEGPAGQEVPVTLTSSILDGCMTAIYTAPAAVGLYRLHVEWAGAALPGTPFSVAVLADQGEVDRHIAVSAATGKPKKKAEHVGEEGDDFEGPSDATAAAAAAAGVAAAAPPDRMALWDRIAAAAYVAVDGGAEGWDSDEEERKKKESSEDAYVAAHPDVPVVESLEDLWLVSKLQNERKGKEEEEKRKKLDAVRAALEGAYGPGQAPSAEEAEAALRDILAAEKAEDNGGEQGVKSRSVAAVGAPPATPTAAESPAPAPRARWGGRAALQASAATLDDLA